MTFSIKNVYYRALHVMVSVGCLAVGTVAFAQTAPFPSRPVTIVVPNAPGGAIDILARLLEKNLSDKWKQPVLVVYKAGAGTVLGTDFVAKAPADGYSIGMVVTSHVINPSLRDNLPFDTLKDLAGVTMLATSPVVISAAPSLPVNNFEIAKWARVVKVSGAKAD